jgi:hypothetical protein
MCYASIHVNLSGILQRYEFGSLPLAYPLRVMTGKGKGKEREREREKERK